MAERIVRVTFRTQDWSGWTRDYIPTKHGAQIAAREREALCLESFAPAGAAKDLDNDSFAIWPVRIWDHKAIFHYRRLVIEHPTGGYGLGPPYSGDIVLRIGQHIRFATPTMDAGVSAFLRLDVIEMAPLPEKN